ncbi:MAG: GerMN domain-containing protein [Actinobacteria bacterium]|nr:GerMN domain-containing protein [Chloroflexota bacterium]MBE3129000.1 GerMN domain-containing protein [Actinomycetota bacterium]
MISNKKGDHNYILLLFLLFIFVISFTFYACSFNNQPKDKIDVGEEDPFLNQSNTSNNNEDLKSETMQDSKEEETTEEDEQTDLKNEEELEEDKDKETSEESKETESLTIKVYYADSIVQYLVGEERIISGTHKYLSAFMEILKPPLEPGHKTLVPPTTKVNKISFDNGNITLDLSPEFVNDKFEGDAVDILLVHSIVNTFTEFPEVNTVSFYINGKRLNTLGQLDISNPLYREESWIREN